MSPQSSLENSSLLQDKIHIAIALDRNFVNQALVAIASLLAHHPDGDIILYVLHAELEQCDFQRIQSLSRIASFKLVPLQIQDSFLKDWSVRRWSITTFYRLLLPSLLPELKKILYVDCDLIFLDDVKLLWDFDLGSHSCAAVAEHRLPKHLIGTHIPPENAYFNAGVMLYNLHKMAEDQDEKRFVENFNKYCEQIRYVDQDVLNLVYWNEFARLPLRWNISSSTYRYPADPTVYTDEDTREALHHPGIAHFAGLHKPWQLTQSTHHPYARYYRHYARMGGLPLAFQLKLALKALITGRLDRPKKKVPWDASIVDKHIPLKRTL